MGFSQPLTTLWSSTSATTTSKRYKFVCVRGDAQALLPSPSMSFLTLMLVSPGDARQVPPGLSACARLEIVRLEGNTRLPADLIFEASTDIVKFRARLRAQVGGIAGFIAGIFG